MSDFVVPKYHDSEISKAEDFNFNAESIVAALHALFDNSFEDSAASFVISGMNVTQLTPPSMNVAVKKGIAFSRVENLLLNNAADLNVPVSAAHLSQDRLDTLEVRYLASDFEPEERAFKDPVTGAITYATVNTKTKAAIEGRCLAGTPGSGVAPNTEAGWTKLAEVSVPAGTTQIIDALIRNITAPEEGVNNSSWTAERQLTYYLGSGLFNKSAHLAHLANNITSANTVHGIRQGAGNGFDADMVDGVQVERIVYGDTATGVTEVNNANSIVKAGFYGIAPPFINAPTEAAYIILSMRMGPDRRCQIAIGSSSSQPYMRNYNGSVWSSWVKLWTADNDGSGSGLDADTVDGINSTELFRQGATYAGDCDSLTLNTWAVCTDAATNTPEAGNYFSILTFGDATNTQQIAFGYSTTTQFYIRRRLSSTWGAWVKIWSASNDGAGSGLDADTVDGVTSSQIVSGVAGRATSATSNLDSLVKSGFYYSSDTAKNPTAASYFILHHVADSTDSTAYQIAVRPAASPDMYIRYNAGGTWQAWQRIWTAGTDGAGSGLDADTVDGLHAAAGTYTPTITPSSANITIYSVTGRYSRVGNVVTVSGRIMLFSTGTGGSTNNSSFDISLPVASNFTDAGDCTGFLSSQAITADTTNDRAETTSTSGFPVSVSPYYLNYLFQYEVK